MNVYYYFIITFFLTLAFQVFDNYFLFKMKINREIKMRNFKFS